MFSKRRTFGRYLLLFYFYLSLLLSRFQYSRRDGSSSVLELFRIRTDFCHMPWFQVAFNGNVSFKRLFRKAAIDQKQLTTTPSLLVL